MSGRRGIVCPECGGEMRVVDSRPMDGYRWRRHKCCDPKCDGRETSYDKPAGQMIRDRILIAKISEIQKSLRAAQAELDELRSLCFETNI